MGAAKKTFWQRFRKQGALQVFVLAGMVYFLIFYFFPMFWIFLWF